MARINLLPWREELRQERQRQFMTAALATAVVGIVLVFVTGLLFDQAINYQQARNRTIQGEIAKLQVQIRRIEELEQTRARLLSRKQIIENLQASRSLTVEMMDQLAKSIPVGVTLNTVTQQGMNVTLSGTSQSNARVSAYLQSLDENELFVDPDLAFVRVAQRDASPVEPYEFSIRVKLRSPQDEEGDMVEGGDMAAAQGGA